MALVLERSDGAYNDGYSVYITYDVENLDLTGGRGAIGLDAWGRRGLHCGCRLRKGGMWSPKG